MKIIKKIFDVFVHGGCIKKMKESGKAETKNKFAFLAIDVNSKTSRFLSTLVPWIGSEEGSG